MVGRAWEGKVQPDEKAEVCVQEMQYSAVTVNCQKESKTGDSFPCLLHVSCTEK